MYSFLVKKEQNHPTVQDQSSPAKKAVTVITVDNEGNEKQDIFLSTPAPKGQGLRTRNSLTPNSEEACQHKNKLRGARSTSTSPVSIPCMDSTCRTNGKGADGDAEDCTYGTAEQGTPAEVAHGVTAEREGKDASVCGAKTKRKISFPDTQEKLDELKDLVDCEKRFAEENLLRQFDKGPLHQYLSSQVNCEELKVSVCISIEGSSAPLSELASHVLSNHSECYDATINLTAIRNTILSLANRVTYRNEIPSVDDVLEDTDPLYWWTWEVKDLKLFGKSVERKLADFRKIRKKMAERFTASENLRFEVDKYDELASLMDSNNLERVAKLLSAFNNCIPLPKSYERFMRWKGEQPEKVEEDGIQDPSPSRALNTSKEERELQRLKTQAEKVKHREQKLAERKRVREQQDAEREEKKKKREEKKAKIEAEQAAKTQEAQRKAEERQRKAAEVSRLEELKSREKKKQAQVMAKFLAQSENSKPSDSDSQLVSPESQADIIVRPVDNKNGEMKFLPLSPKSQTCIISHYGKPITENIDESMLVDWNASFLLEENMVKWKGLKNQRPFHNRKPPSSQKTRRQLNFSNFGDDDVRKELGHRRGRILLQFQEDSRPAYYGTFSKRSCIISGRKPFAKDENKVEDYDYDSGDEWCEPEDGESLKGSDEEMDDEEKETDGQEEEEDGFVVPDGYLSSDEIIYFDSADAADEEETSRGDLQDNSGEETNVRSIAELNALHQFISVAEKAKQHNKPIVITDEAILQAFPVRPLTMPALESNESSEADDSQLVEDDAPDDSKNSRQPKEFPEELRREIIMKLNSEIVKSAVKFSAELVSSCQDCPVKKGEVHKCVKEVAEYIKSNSRWEVKSEFLEDLGIERQNIVKTPAKKSRQEKSRQEKVLSKGYTSITSFFGKNAEEKGVSGDINRVEDEKTSKTEESASSNAAGSITGLEQEAETSNSNTIDQTLLLNSPTSGSLQNIIDSNMPQGNSFAFHQFDKDLIDSVIHKVSPAMAECLVSALGNQSLSFDDRLRVVYAVANLTHCAREHLKREEDQNGPFQILRVVYQSSKVLDMLKRLREEEDVELVRGLFLLLNILLHDPLDKNSKIYPFQVELAQVLISLEWCDSIIGGLSHHDDQIAARAACTSYHLLALGSQESVLSTGLTRWHVLKEVTENLCKPLIAIRKYCLKCLNLLLSTEDELDKLGVFSDLQKHLQTLQSPDTREDIALLSHEVATKCSQQLKRLSRHLTS